MGDQEPDVNNHIYEEHYLASDDDNVIEDLDFPDNDTLYNDGFQTGESSNPNLEDANNDEDENHFVDEDIEVNIDYSEGQPHVTHDYVSLGGTLYWTPIVLDDIKPKVSSKFNSYGEAETMYRKYALESGFDVRLGRVQKMKNGIITNRHLVCNREERHNHELFSKGNMHLSRSKRKVDYSQEIFIHNLSKQNIGPVKAHRLYSALQVGPSVRGGLVTDFKNARRNLNCYIGGRDAKFLVDEMNDRKKNVPSFTFEYKVSNKRLNSLLWADETTKYNYNSFGDVISLDATFSMNKYDMVFVPFTGIDNHKKCVTFGAGLLSKEDGVSYEWLLRDFLKAFRKQPQLVLSDQDPALKKAIDKVFPLTHHRLCMWHITKKLPNKVQKEISRSEDNCFQKNVISSNGVDTIIVMEKTKNITIRQTNDVDVDDKDEEYSYDCLIRDTEYTVTHSTKDGSFKCTCMHFEHLESDVNDIQNPTDIRNKGFGSRGKRLKSTKEMIEKEISKPKRKCATCEQMVHHDKRNCPLKNTKK
ncbi:protein FAR1-RELATED SEQUENCE 5-like [Lactuca sativa]|uniref:protein FAR1-RELATED SEQUENCE 5-like n=1 Tax=Lactuca sativa TaxID=4236 RepID=UPI0022AF2272|nr:protein FAR1-RELATED SEQUENCE 5-like [Lactuca sativa]